MAEDASGASTNERLLAAARTDNEELLLEVFQQEDLDINHQDGLGNTGVYTHKIRIDEVNRPSTIMKRKLYTSRFDCTRVSQGSTDVLEHILTHEDCDVDPVNRLDKATPLHLAVQTEDPEMRRYLVESLLEAGANTNVKDKHGDTPMAYLPDDDKEVKALIRKAQAQASVSNDDVANDDDDEPGSGSGSGSDDE